MMFKNNFIIRFFDELYGKYIIGKEFNKIGVDELDRIYKICQINLLEDFKLYNLLIKPIEHDENSLSIEYYGSNDELNKKLALIYDYKNKCSYKKVDFWFENNITTICFDRIYES